MLCPCARPNITSCTAILTMPAFNPPSEFDFSLPDAWPKWKKRFSRYRSAVELTKKDEPTQISTLLYAMGQAAESVFSQLTFDNAGDEDKYEKVIEKLDAYFPPSRNVFHQRSLFEQCIYIPDESVEASARKLHDAATYCNFKDQKDNRIRDRFVAHLLDRQVALELQKEDPDKLTLTSAIQKARQAEQVATAVAAQTASKTRLLAAVASATGSPQSSSSAQAQAAYHAGSAMPRKPRWKKPNQHQRQPGPSERHKQTSSPHESASCPWCGSDTTHQMRCEECPANGHTCSVCNKPGHFAAVCRSKAGHQGAHIVQLPAANTTPPASTAILSRG